MDGPPPDAPGTEGPRSSSGRIPSADLLLAEQGARAARGLPYFVEYFLTRYAGLADQIEILIDLIYNEFLLRQKAGEPPEVSEYQKRFPAHAEEIALLLEVDAFMDDDSEEIDEPDPHATVHEPPAVEEPSTPSRADCPRLEHYEILDEVGSGAMGVVYRAHDRRRGVVVALKTMQRVDASSIKRFKDEFRHLADVSHPNLVSLYELFSDESSLYIAMEFVDGVDFLEYVRGGSVMPSHSDLLTTIGPPPHDLVAPTIAEDTLPPTDHGTSSLAAGRVPEGVPVELTAVQKQRLRDALRQLAEGLIALHEAGKLHRDVKPSNVRVGRRGRVVLLDFGLATEHGRDARNLSTEGNIVGTLAYMPPEQATGQRVEESGDWYSVGVMLYEALTGRLPFVGSGLDVLIDKQRYDPAPPSELAPGVPEDLNALCVDLLRRDANARPTGREVLRRLGVVAGETAEGGPGTASTDTLFVGRETHRAALDGAFEVVRQGRPVLMFVHGRSGVGKSALVQRFLDELAESDEAVVLAGRCYERESMPYKALDSLIDALSRYLRRLPGHEARALLPRDVGPLARVFPVLRQVEAIAAGPRRAVEAPDPQELRRRAFLALRELLARIGDRAPLVLAIDDLQWGDLDSLAVVTEILRPPDPPLLLLLGCYRTEDADGNAFLRAMLAPYDELKLDRRDLAIEPLSFAESVDLARRLIGGAGPAVDRQAEAVARESGGNPMFVAELARAVQAGRREAAPAAEGRIALDEVLWSRIVRLPDDARELLQVVAVSGRPLPPAVAWRCLEREGDDRAALALLRAGRLLRGTTGPVDGELVETYHDRVRETIVAHLDADSLRNAHRRLASAFEAAGQADPEVLATHLLEAGERGRAGAFFEQAAARAAEALAFDRAARLYRLALENGPGGRALREALGDALAKAGRGSEAARAYLSACEAATVAQTLELRRRAAMQFLISGHIDEGLDALRVVLASVGMRLPRGSIQTIAALVAEEVRVRIMSLKFRPRDPSELAAAELTRIDVCWSAGIGLSVVDWIRGAIFHRRGLRLAMRAGEPFRVGRALAMEAAQAATMGVPARKRTAALLERSGELSREFSADPTNTSRTFDRSYTRGMQPLAHGISAYLEGRWREGLVRCDEAVRIFREECSGVAWELDTGQAFALWALSHLGEWSEAGRRYPVLIKEARERGDKYAVMNLSTYIQALVRLAADEPDEAREEVRRMMSQWSRQGYHVQHNDQVWAATLIELYRGDGPAAWELVERYARPQLTSGLLMVQFIRVNMRSLRGRCALAAAETAADPRPMLRQAEGAARLLDRGRPLVDRGRFPGAAAQAMLIRAALADRQGRDAAALDLLDRAAREFDAADMALCAAVVRRRRGELLGGDAGRDLCDAADAWMRSQTIRNPARVVAMYAPGFRPR